MPQGVSFTPVFLGTTGDEIFIGHQTNNPLTTLLFYNNNNDWKNYGFKFSENLFSQELIDFNSLLRINGFESIGNQNYVISISHGLLNFDKNNTSQELIYVHDIEDFTSSVIDLIYTDKASFALLQAGINEPRKLYKLKIDSIPSSINSALKVVSYTRLYNLQGKELFIEPIGLPFLKVIKYDDGSTTVKKILKN